MRLEHFKPLIISGANLSKDTVIQRIHGGREFQLQLQKANQSGEKNQGSGGFLQKSQNLLKQIKDNLTKLKQDRSIMTSNNQIRIF